MSNQPAATDKRPAGAPASQANGFALSVRDRSGASGIDLALERNGAFAATAGHEGAVVFPSLRLFVITCLDPRVDPAHFLGLELSDAMVVRNVGGRVTPEVINDIAFIGQVTETVLPDGPLFEVAVIHHTQCGAGAFADDTFRRTYAERTGADELILRERAVLDPAATAARDVERLRSAPSVSPRIMVSGHVYDVTTGLVTTVLPARGARGRSVKPRRSAARHDTPGQPVTRSFDPTQGRQIGSHPYDDPTQGRKVGSDPYDDPTRAA